MVRAPVQRRLIDEDADECEAKLGVSLLPEKTRVLAPNLSACFNYCAAFSLPGNYGISGPQGMFENRIRVLMTKTNPGVAVIDVNSITTFNMLDPDSGSDFKYAMETLLAHMRQKTTPSAAPVISYVFQGAGPHFCPGGNHHPVQPRGATFWSAAGLNNFSHYGKLRQLGIPGCTPMQGSNVGGGAATSLNTTMRIMAKGASISFGNISRGAVPILQLSKHLPKTCSFHGAVEIYLTDNTYSSARAVHCTYATELCSTVNAVKARALDIAKRTLTAPQAKWLFHMHFRTDTEYILREARGIMLAGLSGTMFANVGAAGTEGPTIDVEEKDGNNLECKFNKRNTVAHLRKQVSKSFNIPSDKVTLTVGDQLLVDTDSLAVSTKDGSLKVTVREKSAEGGDEWGEEYWDEEDSTEYGASEEWTGTSDWGGSAAWDESGGWDESGDGYGDSESW